MCPRDKIYKTVSPDFQMKKNVLKHMCEFFFVCVFYLPFVNVKAFKYLSFCLFLKWPHWSYFLTVFTVITVKDNIYTIF